MVEDLHQIPVPFFVPDDEEKLFLLNFYLTAEEGSETALCGCSLPFPPAVEILRVCQGCRWKFSL